MSRGGPCRCPCWLFEMYRGNRRGLAMIISRRWRGRMRCSWRAGEEATFNTCI